MASPSELFGQMNTALKADPTLAKKVGGVLQFVLTSPDEQWVVDCKEGVAKSGKAAKADCTITISSADLLAMASGKLTGMAAFMAGKMKLSGNMALAQKFGVLVEAAQKAKPPVSPAAAPAAAAGPAGFECVAIFEQIRANLSSDPALSKKVNGVFLFNITGGAGGSKASWTVDAKSPGGSVTVGAGAKADCTLTLSDADFVAMASGKLTGMSAFMGGKLKISGNMALAQKFNALAESKKAKL